MTRPVILFLSIILIALGLVQMGISQEKMEPKGVIVKPPQESKLTVEVWTDRSRYTPDERVKIYFHINKRSYVYIYNIDTQGRVNLLFPNKFDQKNWLEAGKHQIPGKGYSLVVEEPEGFEYLQAIASFKPLPVLSPITEKTFEKAPFPLLSQKSQQFKEQIEDEISQEISPKDWTTDWTSFLVAEDYTRLTIISHPPQARLYVDNRYLGKTPMELSVEPGRVKITLKKEGFQEWEKRLNLPSGKHLEVEAKLNLVAESITDLEMAPSPTKEIDQIISTVGANLGWDNEDRLSFGIQVGIKAIQGLYWGLALRDTGDSVPPYYDLGNPQPWEGEVLNQGPELEFYLAYQRPFFENLHLWCGVGLSLQDKIHLEPVDGVSASVVTEISPQIEIGRNAYTETELNFAYLGGFAIQFQDVFLSLIYENRRKWIIGVDYQIGGD